MQNKRTPMEGLIYLDGRFNLQAIDDGFLIEESLLVDVFGTIEKAAAYYEARGGRLEPSHGGMHMLWKRASTETKSAEGGPAEFAFKPIAYFYHDANVATEAHPWRNSMMLVFAQDRRPGLRGETELFTRAQLDAAVDAQRERCAKAAEEFLTKGRNPYGRAVAEAIRKA